MEAAWSALSSPGFKVYQRSLNGTTTAKEESRKEQSASKKELLPYHCRDVGLLLILHHFCTQSFSHQLASPDGEVVAVVHDPLVATARQAEVEG